MKKLAITMFTIICFCIACKQTPKTNSNPITEKVKTEEDSVYQQVLELHNKTMAKYGKLLGYEKKVQQKVDSIKQYLQKNNCYCEGTHDALRNTSVLLTNVKDAEKSMNDWMAQFNPDPTMKTTEERTQYFISQRKLAEFMSKSYFQTLSRADSFFNGTSK